MVSIVLKAWGKYDFLKFDWIPLVSRITLAQSAAMSCTCREEWVRLTALLSADSHIWLFEHLPSSHPQHPATAESRGGGRRGEEQWRAASRGGQRNEGGTGVWMTETRSNGTDEREGKVKQLGDVLIKKRSSSISRTCSNTQNKKIAWRR